MGGLKNCRRFNIVKRGQRDTWYKQSLVRNAIFIVFMTSQRSKERLTENEIKLLT